MLRRNMDARPMDVHWRNPLRISRRVFFVPYGMTPDRRSSAAEAYHRWYKTARWQARRADQIAREPLCAFCLAQGRVTPATVADHVEPHRGDPDLFWHGDLQSLCDADPWRCHSSTKAKAEQRGYLAGSDVAGRPVDPSHPWNRR